MKKIVTLASVGFVIIISTLYAETQTINFTIPQLLLFTIEGGSVTLDISSELDIAGGGSAVSVSDDTTNYNFFLMGQPGTAKITAELSANMPVGTTLSATMDTDGTVKGSPSPSSQGEKILSITPLNLVTSINNGAVFASTLTYQFGYDPATADLSATSIPSVIVTYTISAE